MEKERGILINKLVEEIRKSLDNDIYLSALIIALTLPDICGKAAFPNYKPSDRYIKWYDDYIGQYEMTEGFNIDGIPYTSGLIIYNLRNSLMHEGNPNINEKTCDIQEFELLLEDKNKQSIYMGSAGVRTEFVDNEVVSVTKRLCINVRQICFKICACAEYYYKENKEKFDFFNSKLTYWNPQAKEVFLCKRKID